MFSEYLRKTEQTSPAALGRCWGMVNAILQVLLNFSSKSITGTDGTCIVFERCLVAAALSYAAIKHKNVPIWPSTDFDKNTHIIRMLIGGTGIVLLHTSLTLLPLQIVTVIIALNIPVNIIMLAILGKRSPLIVWVCIIAAFLGEVLVIDPRILGFGSSSYSPDQINPLGIGLTLAIPILMTTNRIYLSG